MKAAVETNAVVRSCVYIIPSCPTFDFLPQSQLLPRNDHPLDLAGAFVNLGDLRIAEVAFDWQFFGIAHTAVDLHRRMRTEHGRLGGEQLGHRGLQSVTLARRLAAFLG